MQQAIPCRAAGALALLYIAHAHHSKREGVKRCEQAQDSLLQLHDVTPATTVQTTVAGVLTTGVMMTGTVGITGTMGVTGGTITTGTVGVTGVMTTGVMTVTGVGVTV